jgi:hypothetical protein
LIIFAVHLYFISFNFFKYYFLKLFYLLMYKMSLLKPLESVPLFGGGVKWFDTQMHNSLFQHSVFGAIVFLVVSNTGVYKFVKDIIFDVTGYKADGNTMHLIHAVVFAVIMYFGSLFILAPLLTEGQSPHAKPPNKKSGGQGRKGQGGKGQGNKDHGGKGQGNKDHGGKAQGGEGKGASEYNVQTGNQGGFGRGGTTVTTEFRDFFEGQTISNMERFVQGCGQTNAAVDMTSHITYEPNGIGAWRGDLRRFFNGNYMGRYTDNTGRIIPANNLTKKDLKHAIFPTSRAADRETGVTSGLHISMGADAGGGGVDAMRDSANQLTNCRPIHAALDLHISENFQMSEDINNNINLGMTGGISGGGGGGTTQGEGTWFVMTNEDMGDGWINVTDDDNYNPRGATNRRNILQYFNDLFFGEDSMYRGERYNKDILDFLDAVTINFDYPDGTFSGVGGIKLFIRQYQNREQRNRYGGSARGVVNSR